MVVVFAALLGAVGFICAAISSGGNRGFFVAALVLFGAAIIGFIVSFLVRRIAIESIQMPLLKPVLINRLHDGSEQHTEGCNQFLELVVERVFE